MNNLVQQNVAKFQIYRSKKLGKLAQFLVNLKIKAGYLTLLSFLSALLAVYFLFNNWYLLVLFTILHLLFDGIDGVVARIEGETFTGKLMDTIADNLPIFLMVIKLGWSIKDVYAYVIAGIYLLVVVIHLLSKLRAPFIPFRTASFLVMIIITLPLFNYTKPSWIMLSYLAAGVISSYTLAQQLQYFIVKNRFI